MYFFPTLLPPEPPLYDALHVCLFSCPYETRRILEKNKYVASYAEMNALWYE